MLNSVIFDLDGVIINSEPLMRFAFERAYHEVTRNGQPPIGAFFEHMGKSLPIICQEIGLPPSFTTVYRRICCENVHRVNVFPGIEQLLGRLHAEGTQMGILTGKELRRTHQILSHFDLQRFFSPVIACDMLSKTKPHPEGIQRILAAHGCAPADAVMVGDAVSDIQCAQRAGVCAIGVTWGINPDHMLDCCQPDYVVHQLDELQQLLQTMIERKQVAV